MIFDCQDGEKDPETGIHIIQAFREDFIPDPADLPARYPAGTILYLSQSLTVPVLVVKLALVTTDIFQTLKDGSNHVTHPSPVTGKDHGQHH